MTLKKMIDERVEIQIEEDIDILDLFRNAMDNWDEPRVLPEEQNMKLRAEKIINDLLKKKPQIKAILIEKYSSGEHNLYAEVGDSHVIRRYNMSLGCMCYHNVLLIHEIHKPEPSTNLHWNFAPEPGMDDHAVIMNTVYFREIHGTPLELREWFKKLSKNQRNKAKGESIQPTYNT